MAGMWREGAVGVATWLAVSAAGRGGAPGRDDAHDASGIADLPPVSYTIDAPRPSDVPRVDPFCHPGQVRCGSTGSCYDVSTNRENCGSCGRVCDPQEQCVAGICASLGGDEAYCGRQVVHLASDPRHCGGCYRVCGLSEDCAGGVCGAIDAGHAGDVPRDVPPDAGLELPPMPVSGDS